MAQDLPFSELSVEIPPARIAGDLQVPVDAKGLVIFAHGSGSSRFSVRNRFVAGVLQQVGFATLLLDLLTAREEDLDLQTSHLRFDIDLLARRLIEATKWSGDNAALRDLPAAYFGASTGAAAALIAAAELADTVHAVVSRGGRPDLASSALSRVKAPTLLIVGGDDAPVIELNRRAFNQLRCEKKLEIVPGATHLFEEPSTLEQVAALASGWFNDHVSMKFNARSIT
ncbi:MAG TPA: dienelactone hydrolase family protein [Bryobacteraceae bacterium]|nr:dienelactone hydrolase family protein [Bryobacteraceae bacterium]